MRALSIVPAALILLAAPAVAQQAVPTNAGDDLLTRETVTVGAGVATIPSYEGADNNRLIPIVAARGTIEGFNFSVQGTKLFVDVVRDRDRDGGLDIQLGPVAGFNAYRTSRKTINDDQVEALGKLDTSIELGGYAGIGKTGVITSAYDTLAVNVTYVHDVANAHDSYTITPAVTYGTPLSRKAYVGLSGSVTYAGNGYARTYFSVTPAGSLASGLPVYNARGGWKNYTLGALGTYSLTGDLLHGFKLVAGGTYRRMLNDFGDSPLVSIAGSRTQWLGAVGLAYTF